MASEQAQAPIEEAPLALSNYSKRVLLQTIFSHPDGLTTLIGQRVVVGGWVKSSREFRKEMPPPHPSNTVIPKDITCTEVLQTKLPFFRSIIKIFGGDHHIRDKLDTIIMPRPPQPSISILQISDGSCTSSLRVLIDSSLASPGHVMPTGTCILVQGVLQKPSLQDKEIIELKTEKVLHIGLVDQDKYPLSKKRIPLESLRDSAHFRPRTTTVASVMRIRNGLTQATNTFFQENGFIYVQVPVITSTDCEGKGKVFQVTTGPGKEKIVHRTIGDEIKLETVKASIKEKSKQVEELKRSESNKEALAVAMQDLKKTSELVSQLESKQRGKSKGDDFFHGDKAYLTASGRMHLESCASGLGNVYSFGPRFHANKSESKKLLAEMWVVELEMAFSELEDSMECATDFLKFVCKWILEKCAEDLKFVSKRVDKLTVDRLQLIATSPFEKVSYTEVVEVLNKGKFERKMEWGGPLSEEQENYLTDEIYKKPIIIYNYPKQLKPFNARINDDIRTCASFDVIVPKVGTLIRGSQNEERVNILSARINELGVEKQQYEWYVDLHKHGGVKCSGFSFVLDPLVLYATGLNDVRDAVPFPRSYGKLNN